MNPKSREFKALQKEWYDKLKAEGFEDAEQDEDHLKVWSKQFFKVRHNQTLFEAKEEYYRLAGKFLHDYTFLTPLDRTIWEMHAEGLSIRDIVDNLKQANHKTYRRHVHEKLQSLANAMLEFYGSY